MKTRTATDHGPRDRTFRVVTRTVLLAGMLFFPALSSFGQSGLPRRMFGLTIGALFPTGAFNDHVSQDGFGVGTYYGWRLRHAPVYWGFELTLHIYGHVRREEYLEGIPEVPLDVVTENNIGQGLLFVRLQPRSGKVMTFVRTPAARSEESFSNSRSGIWRGGGPAI
jgi:hypothetical protein